MTEEIFYCERPRCSVHNKKTQDLAYNLKAFRNAEFVFSEKFTPVMLFEVLKSVVAAAEKHYGGKYNPETLRVRPVKVSKSMCSFEPFQKVLVRDAKDEVWKADYFSHYEEGDKIAPYVCVGSYFRQCVPYEGSEHLLGTDKSPK